MPYKSFVELITHSPFRGFLLRSFDQFNVTLNNKLKMNRPVAQENNESDDQIEESQSLPEKKRRKN